MQRAVVLAVAAGVIMGASVVGALLFPRYACPDGFRVRPVGAAARAFDDPVYCFEEEPFEFGQGQPLADEVSDRLWIKIGLAVGGTVLGGLVALYAFA